MAFGGFPDETYRFLRGLRRHNEREWFLERKDVYLRVVRAPMEELVADVGRALGRFAGEFTANPKTSIYRIYRDVRFSPDKSPYKTHIAAVFPHRDLGKHLGAGFYVHVSPEDVFAGGGLYRPGRRELQAVRSRLATQPERFRRLIRAARFHRVFGELSGEQLTRVPRGFPADHPAGDLLRYVQFLAGRSFPSEAPMSPRFARDVVETFRALLPLCRFLNAAILDDPAGQQSLDLTD
jgi:uncharacterized protein (TIGR02453 family)